MPAQIEDLVQRYLGGAERDALDPILDACVAVYKDQLDDDPVIAVVLLNQLILRPYLEEIKKP